MSPAPDSAADETADYVDPILFEIGFFKDRTAYNQFMDRAVEELRTGRAKTNERALRPLTPQERAYLHSITPAAE